MYDDLTIEDLRQVILERDKTLSEANKEVEIYKEQITNKDSEITKLGDTISDLKQKNYDLFIQIPQTVNNNEQNKNEVNTNNDVSVFDIVYKLTSKE